MSDQHKLVRIKRKWVPEWLFAILAWPVDLIVPKWLPFRWIITEPYNPPPHWEAVPDDKECQNGKGETETMWRVRWSEQTAKGWLYVRHYGGNGTMWNKHAAERNAEIFNEQHRQPWEFNP